MHGALHEALLCESLLPYQADPGVLPAPCRRSRPISNTSINCVLLLVRTRRPSLLLNRFTGWQQVGLPSLQRVSRPAVLPCMPVLMQLAGTHFVPVMTC